MKNGRGWGRRLIKALDLGLQDLGSCTGVRLTDGAPVPGLHWGGGNMAGPGSRALRWSP